MPLKRPISVIGVDRKSHDFGDLPAQFGWLHFCVYDRLRLGLDADGIPTDVWINVVASIFCARAGLKASWVTFANILRWLVTALNPDASEPQLWPDLQLILDVLKAAPDTLFSAKREYTWSLLQQLEGITQASGDLFRTFRGFQAERDIIAPGQSAVISMPNMFPSWARQFFVDLILAQILYGRMQRSHRVDATEVLIVIEEADADISTEAEEMFPDRMCPVSDAFKKGREFGLSICVSISSPQSASRFVLSNATDHFIFRMTDAASVSEAGRTLMLPPKGDLRLNSLGQGECLARQAGSWPHAVALKVDYMPPCRTQPIHYDTHPYVPSKRLSELPHVQKALAAMIADSRRITLHTTPQKANPQTLSKLARLFLDYVALPEYIYTPVFVIFKRMGVTSPATQLAIIRELEEAGFLTCTQTRIGKATVRLKAITEKGWAFLQKPAPATEGRGGIEHCHFAHWVHECNIRSGYQRCQIEPGIPGTTHFGDAAFEKEGKWYLAQVVAHCDSNIISHVRAAFIESHAVDTLIFVTPMKSQWDDIRMKVASDSDLLFLGKIEYDAVESYLRRLWM